MWKKISYGIVVVCLTGLVLWHQGLLVTHVKPGRVVLLDGTSSVGKSAIIGEFKKLYPEYAVIKVDDWFPLDLTNVAQAYG
jgi:chloramphenicol 3-O-phosphotransferase